MRRNSCDSPIRYKYRRTLREKMSTGVVEFYNHGVVEAVIGVCE